MEITKQWETHVCSAFKLQDTLNQLEKNGFQVFTIILTNEKVQHPPIDVSFPDEINNTEINAIILLIVVFKNSISVHADPLNPSVHNPTPN